MRTAVDTNIISALWSGERTSNQVVDQLGASSNVGSVVICGVVYAELFAHPNATVAFISNFLKVTDIQTDYGFSEAVWKDTANRFKIYAERRRINRTLPKRLLADFLVGSHALLHADRLLTLDASRYRTDYPELQIFS